ncbi:hypothetical protein [Flavobacterium ajazii]|uniref:hypothetical protein n=1 Tax=Flavobacterium ajazii TaxID=2692318 RepID=UPI0013D7EF91|nr:hypothetical protein [Flavobacterium ajazii]
MKKIIAFIFLCFSQYVISQAQLNPKLPEIISASPEASALGQYGSTPINLSSGQLNISIPIYTIKVGEFEYPLTLSYNYNGFKPDTDPTMVGMGWTANFGGAVIRQLQAVEDEAFGIGYFTTGKTYENLENLSTMNRVYALQQALDLGFDYRPDNFILNTSTINGNFRFNTDKVPIFSEHKNYKVNLTLGNMKITDDKGILYDFNDPETTELTQWQGDIQSTQTSAFMLSEIKLPSNDSVTFEYDGYISSHIYMDKYKETKNNFKSWRAEPNIDLPMNDGGIYKANISSDIILGKIIKKINFPGGYIIFDQLKESVSAETSTINLPAGNTERIKLNSVRIYDSNNVLLHKYEFEYFANTGYYYFLKSIKRLDSNNLKKDFYDFEYSNLEYIPYKRISGDKVDLWGFYNETAFNDSDVIASTLPSFEKTKIGALTKITYPTKGNTTFVYEPHQVKRIETGYYDPANQAYDSLETVELSSQDSPNDCDENIKSINIPFDQYAKITLEVDVTANKTWAKAALKTNAQEIENLTKSQEYLQLQNASNYHFVDERLIWIAAGAYQISAELCEIALGLGTGNHFAKTTIEYRSTPYTSSINPVETNINIGGIRIFRTVDHADNAVDIVKEYKYCEDINSLKSSGYLMQPNPGFISSEQAKGEIYAKDCNFALDGAVFYSNMRKWATYDSKVEHYRPVTPLTSLGSHVLYTNVQEINNNASVGKTDNEFKIYVPVNVNPVFPTLLSEDVDFKNGKLSKKRLFEWDEQSDSCVLKQITENEYQEIRIHPTVNPSFDCQIKRYPEDITYIDENGQTYKDTRLSRVLISVVKHEAKKYQLDGIYEELNEKGGKIKTQKLYNYYSDTGYPSEEITNDSKGNKIIEKYYYPHNKSILSGLNNQQETAIDSLKSRNIVANPIQIEKIKNTQEDVLLSKSTQRTNYKIWPNDMVLPEAIQISKNNEILEDRIQYHNYYASGNLKEVSQKDGVHIIYLWGYNNQYPIAKIENATNSQIASALGVSNLDSINESNLSAINALRTSQPNSMITTYTYKPLVGMSTMTDPKGYTIYYLYDSFGRLEFTKDALGNILSENKYNYKQ